MLISTRTRFHALTAASLAALLAAAPSGAADSRGDFAGAVRNTAPRVTANMDNPAAREGARSLRARMLCESRFPPERPGHDRSAEIDKCTDDEMAKPEGSASPAAPSPAPGVATPPPPLARPPAANAGASAFVPSDDPRAIFGLLVGGKTPERAAVCEEGKLFSDKPVMRPNTHFCISKLGSSLQRLGDELFGLSGEDYQAIGIAPVTILVNDKIYDTSIADNITLFVDRQTHVLQRMQITTLLVAEETILAMLTRKFGRPHRQTSTTWTNRQTGAVIGRTPNYHWDTPQLRIEYVSKVAAQLNNAPTPLGRIEIMTPVFTQRVDDLMRRKNAPPPGRRPM